MREEIRRVFEAPAPCDECSQREYCAENEVACRAFSGYVINGVMYDHTLRNPNRVLFNKIFNDENPRAIIGFLKTLQDNQKELPL